MEVVEALNNAINFGPRYWYSTVSTETHERYHYEQDFQNIANHYWPQAVSAIEAITAPIDAYPNKADALKAMVDGPNDGRPYASVIWRRLITRVGLYHQKLSEQRAMAAGQPPLNLLIAEIQALAAKKGWTVPAMENPKPDTSNPTYEPWDVFIPWPGGG